MAAVFVLLFFAVPYLLGSALILTFGERSTKAYVTYVYGLLSLFVFFFIDLLIALKADYNLEQLAHLCIITIVATVLASCPLLVIRFKKYGFPTYEWSKRVYTWVIPAAVLGVFAFLFLQPYYGNDITVETAMTTLKTGKLYESSALLGTPMEAGLPIFNKIEIMPMLYAMLSLAFRVPVFVLTTYASPILCFVLNLCLMWEMSRFLVSEERRSLFMLLHLLVLLSGAYLSDIAIPVTAGFSILREGYSGYAWAFGVVAPAVILTILEKHYTLTGIITFSLLGLFRWDRLFFTVKEGFRNYHLMNSAGKLWIIYLLALSWWLVRRAMGKRETIPPLWSGSALISSTIVELYEMIGQKKTCLFGAVFILLSCANFRPFADAKFVFSKPSVSYELEEQVVWAPKEIMEVARREDASIYPAYARDLYDKNLIGVNFEAVSEDQIELYETMEYIEAGFDRENITKHLMMLETNSCLRKVDVVIIPLNQCYDEAAQKLVSLGFSDAWEYPEYLVMRRPNEQS